jgi:hypothetical protein
MYAPCRLAFAAIVLSVSPALGQAPIQPPEGKKQEAELKALEQKLRALMHELEARDPKTAPKNPPAPGGKAQPQGIKVIEAHLLNADPAHAQLLALTKHADPKIAALATELLGLLKKKSPKGAAIEIVLEPGSFKLDKVIDLKNIGIVLEPGSFKFEAPAEKPRTRTPVKEESVTGTSSLKMSSDGKTAAVVATDGSVVVYDVATGRELMRFAGRK